MFFNNFNSLVMKNSARSSYDWNANFNFKNILTRVVVMLLFIMHCMNALSGQTTLFLETMYNGSGGASGDAIAVHESNNRFENDGFTMSGTGDMRTTSASDYSGASGTWNVMLNANTEFFQIKDINTNLYTNLTLSFGIRKGATA